LEQLDNYRISDNELIKQCIKNKRSYQELLYKRFADKMYSVCLIYSENEDDACDILQDGFIKVFNKLNSYNFNRFTRRLDKTSNG